MKKTFYSFLVMLGTVLTAMAQAPGVLNNNFGTSGYQWFDLNSKDQFASAIAIQADGKVLIGASHEHTLNKYDWLIYRVNANGMLDPTFSTDGRVTESFSDRDILEAIAVRPNGKIVLAGYIETLNNGFNMVVMQLDADGSIDNTFGTNGYIELDPSLGGDDYAVDIDIAPNGKIYLAGFMSLSGESYFTAYRLNADGTPDNTFSLNGFHFQNMNNLGAVYDADLAPDGSYFLAGAILENQQYKMAVLKFKDNGQLDDDFAGDGVKVFQPGLNTQAYLEGIVATPDGGVAAVGVKSANGGTDAVMIKLTASGLFDPSFNGNGIIAYDFAQDEGFRKIKRLATGKFLVVAYKTVGGNEKGMLYQLKADGSLDYNDYANGSGKVNISISNTEEVLADVAITNNHAFTVGTYENGNHKDVYVSSTGLSNPVSINEEIVLNPSAVKIFPNPTSKSTPVTILLDDEISGNVSLSILSVTGECIYKSEFYKVSAEYNHQIELPQVPAGLYMVQVNNNGKSATQKLIVQ